VEAKNELENRQNHNSEQEIETQIEGVEFAEMQRAGKINRWIGRHANATALPVANDLCRRFERSGVDRFRRRSLIFRAQSGVSRILRLGSFRFVVVDDAEYLHSAIQSGTGDSQQIGCFCLVVASLDECQFNLFSFDLQ
jgi:hypothetical protein